MKTLTCDGCGRKFPSQLGDSMPTITVDTSKSIVRRKDMGPIFSGLAKSIRRHQERIIDLSAQSRAQVFKTSV